MAYLEVSAFKKIRAFFWALQKSSFNLNKIPFRDNEGTPVDKAYCLNLLRSFPNFQGQEFKDDNFLIKYLSKPGNLKQILDQFTPAQQIELTKVLEEKPPAVEAAGEQPSGGEASAEQSVPAQTPTGTAAGAPGIPGLPSIPSISSAPRRTRVIYNVPHAPEPSKPEISIANKGGTIVKGPGAEPPPAKIYIADKSGTVVREHAIQPTAAAKETQTTKLYVADKSGKVVGERTIPRAPSAFTNFFKNLGSSAQIGIKKFGTRLGSTLSNFLRGASRASEGMLGGAIGGGGRALGRFGLRAADVGANLSQQVSRGSLSLAGPKNKVLAWGLFGGFLLFFVINIAGGIISPQTTPSGQAAPVVGGPSYTGSGAGILSCPLNDGRITCGSQNAGGNCNHCANNYAPYTCPAGGTTGRETAIDVVSSDRLVFLPFIGGGSVTWIIGEAGTPIDPAEGGGGIAIAATATTGEKKYGIRFVHIASTNLKVNDQVPSGTLIGQYISTAGHTHITIQEDGEFKPADTYFKLCTK